MSVNYFASWVNNKLPVTSVITGIINLSFYFSPSLSIMLNFFPILPYLLLCLHSSHLSVILPADYNQCFLTACKPRTVLPSFSVLLMTNYLQNRFSRAELRHKHSTHVPVYLTRFRLILIIFQTACCTSVLPHWKETLTSCSCFFFCSIKGGKAQRQ